ncbi:hypothetical protein PsorP6_002448 [Peronosclerospora sorghi]|uniref:Uncharacterized protein n=1 Tax=Peronosclerospora sorghi TaxID=230839 RepID=A0ACC0WSP4_9STRA|nr:hypothetical protein PsorP6_002448 [Peronosclerospora sorghi]
MTPRKRSLMKRFADGSLRTTIVKQVLVQGLIISDVPVDIHAGEVVVEKENLGGNSFVAERFDLCLWPLEMGYDVCGKCRFDCCGG